MKYNLLRNSIIQTQTSSGTGNIDLSYNALMKLYDSNLTSSGVNLTSSGVLYLDVNLGSRIKVDGIRLYTDDNSKKSFIKFYYKNYENDTYTLLTTYSGTDYYYTLVPTPSAPQFIRTVVSGINIELYELQIFNDDYIVEFGEDGTETVKYLDNAPLGVVGEADTIAIYNNSDKVVNAYACIDYTATSGDEYIEIASDINGPYYGIDDGIILKDNGLSSTYTWDMGDFDNAVVENNSVMMVQTSLFLNNIYIKDLPLSDPSSSLRCGDNAMTWDRFNKKAYFMGLDGSVLRLWEYKYTTDEFNYISDVNFSGTPAPNFAVMAHCQVSGTNRIYAITTYSGGFGYVDIDDVANNWTSLASPPWNFALGESDRIGMCSDGVRYIYVIATKYGGADATQRTFIKFDTVSGTWTELDNGFDSRGSAGGGSVYGIAVSLAYDYDRDYIYAIVTSEEVNNFYYIQRYIVSSNTWNTQYVNYGASFNNNSGMVVISYHNNNIYVGSDYSWDNKIFKYSIPTTNISLLDIGCSHYNIDQNTEGIHLLAIDGPNNNDTLLLASINNNLDKFGVYNWHYIDRRGVYTTPIFSMDDRYKNSYFLLDYDSGSYGNISLDSNIYNGVMYLRSSNTKPVNVNKILWVSQTRNYVDEYDVYTNNITNQVMNFNISWGSEYIYNVAVSRFNGNIAFNGCYQEGGARDYIYIYDNEYNYLGVYMYNEMYKQHVFLDFDVEGGVWGYSDSGKRLIRVNHTYDALSCNIYNGEDFLFDACVEWERPACWYTDKQYNGLRHVDYNGNVLHFVSLRKPRAICATKDGGCWVEDEVDNKLYRYSVDANKVDEMDIPEGGVQRMYVDYDDGFWYINSMGVGHINSNKEVDLFIGGISNLDRLRGGHSCCIIYSFTNYNVRFVDLTFKTILFNWQGSFNGVSVPGLLSFSYEDMVNNHKKGIVPHPDDPIWGTSGMEWNEVPINGYFLPKHKYFQLQLGIDGDAKLNKIIMPPSIKINSIQPYQYRNMYIRTNIPAYVDVKDYQSSIKVWWSE